MRTAIAALISVFMCGLLNAQGVVPGKLEWDVYTLKQADFIHSDPVAFSIGYPKGWTRSENTTVVSDNLGDLASPRDHELVCRFSSPHDPFGPSDPRTIRVLTNYASITIFRSYGATAREEAENFAARLRKVGDEVQSVDPVKTRAGDGGYLLMCGDEILRGID